MLTSDEVEKFVRNCRTKLSPQEKQKPHHRAPSFAHDSRSNDAKVLEVLQQTAALAQALLDDATGKPCS